MCAHKCSRGGDTTCKCGGGRIERFLEPCLLLLLMEAPAHGYDILGRLERFGADSPQPDPGLLYKTLRRLEEGGYLASHWDTEAGGPAKRLYEVTENGEELLHAWTEIIRRNLRSLNEFLDLYQKRFPAKKEDRSES